MRRAPPLVRSLLGLVLAIGCGGGESASGPGSARPAPATPATEPTTGAPAAAAGGEADAPTPAAIADASPEAAAIDAAPPSVSSTAAPSLPPSNLRGDELLRIFPALALPRPEGGHEVRLRIWVFEPEEDSHLRAAALEPLRRALELPEGAEERAIFRDRARPFLVDNERGKRITVTIGGRDHALDVTGANGQSETSLLFTAGELGPGITPVRAKLPAGDARRFEGAIHRLDAAGTSVISDIDDTIKISEVRDRQRLLAATFTRPFEAVPEMAAVYRRWADAGGQFHYVSASPWQLYDALHAFAEEVGYPAGTYHLKLFRWKDSSFYALFQDPVAYKLAILRPLLAAAPGRRFVLVGDSGERDPEIYGALAREFTGAIAHIFIRDVSGEGRDAARYREAFAGADDERWTIFTDAAALPKSLP